MPRSRIVNLAVRVWRPDCPLMILLKELGLKPRFHVVAVQGNESRHIMEIAPGDNLNNVVKILKERRLKVKIVDENRGLLWVDNLENCNFCKAVDDLRGIIVSLSLDDNDNPVYGALMPSRIAASRLVARLKVKGLEPELLEKNGRLAPKLTLRQIHVLTIAYERGFFDVPKKVNLEELAKTLGVKPSTLNEILRKAVKKLIESYVILEKRDERHSPQLEGKQPHTSRCEG
ncbi:MAG: helix-turn-helix domain-containing protein [Thermoprotei archaeon]|nr:helix-turn-helix domain-containing protein [Thermoprotei archaeon]